MAILFKHLVGLVLVLAVSLPWFAGIVGLIRSRSKRNRSEPNDAFGNLVVYALYGAGTVCFWGLAYLALSTGIAYHKSKAGDVIAFYPIEEPGRFWGSVLLYYFSGLTFLAAGVGMFLASGERSR